MPVDVRTFSSLLAIGVTLAAAVACDGESVRPYQVTISFDESATQEEIDQVAAILRTYDDRALLQIGDMSAPVDIVGLETDSADFCPTVEAELEAKTYVQDATCEKR